MNKQPQQRRVACPVCDSLFGFETAPGVLSMKYRDVYRTARGGTVEGPCRRCGAIVRWPGVPQVVEK